MLPALALAAAVAGASETEWRAKVAAGSKLRASAASYFGGAGAESFAGVVGCPGGGVLAYGNSWGPPFPPASVAPAVLGPDMPCNLPAFEGGTPGDDYPYDVPPSAYHAGRTGFLVRYAADLGRVEAVTRFGWGVATVDAALRTSDGGLVTAGMAREGFAAVAKQASGVRRFPAGDGPGYGTVHYGGVPMPGDVYIGRWRDGLDGFVWVWILEKHVDPPPMLFEAPDAGVVFDCRGVKRASADGRSLEAVAAPVAASRTEGRFFAGVNPRSGSLLFAGWMLSTSGQKEWLGPLLEERGAGGTTAARYYDWRASLVCQPAIDLAGAAGITHAGFLPDGGILVGAPTRLGRSVLERSPADVTAPVAARGVFADELVGFDNRSPWNAATRCTLARFDSAKPEDGIFACWAGVSREGRDAQAEELTIEGLCAPDRDHVALWGGSGGALLGTVAPVPVGTNALAIANWKRKPATPFLTVFSSDFREVRWSGLLPRFRIGGVTRSSRGLVAAGTFRQEWRFEPFAPVTAPGAQKTFGGGYCDGHILLLEDAQ